MRMGIFTARTLTAVAMSLGLGQVASAADWNGWYVGVNGGYASGRAKAESSFSCPTGVGCPYVLPSNHALFSAAGTGSESPDGATGGAQLGFNRQNGTLVYGFEVDFNWLDLNSSRTTSALCCAGQRFTVSVGGSTDWLLTGRGRLGWTVSPSTFVYGTGGLAFANLRVSNFFQDTFPPIASGRSESDDTKTGWTAGIGAEMAIAKNMSLKAEYLYVDLGSVSSTAAVNFAGNVNPNLLHSSVDLTAHIFRVGLNFKF